MSKIYRDLIDWAEVWPLFIPLVAMYRYKSKAAYLKPLRLYVWLALIINIIATLDWRYKLEWGFQPGDFWWSNTFLYNIHSIVRLLLFSWFFILLNQTFIPRINKAIPFLFIGFTIVNFLFFEKFFGIMISSPLLATEAATLLFYCLQYFIFIMMEDRTVALNKRPGFWAVTGLTIFVGICFFIFLFYNYLTRQNLTFAVDIWDVHNIAYIVLCLAITREFYERAE